MYSVSVRNTFVHFDEKEASNAVGYEEEQSSSSSDEEEEPQRRRPKIRSKTLPTIRRRLPSISEAMFEGLLSDADESDEEGSEGQSDENLSAHLAADPPSPSGSSVDLIQRLVTRDSFESAPALWADLEEPILIERVTTRDSFEASPCGAEPGIERFATRDSFESPSAALGPPPVLLGQVGGSRFKFEQPCKAPPGNAASSAPKESSPLLPPVCVLAPSLWHWQVACAQAALAAQGAAPPLLAAQFPAPLVYGAQMQQQAFLPKEGSAGAARASRGTQSPPKQGAAKARSADSEQGRTTIIIRRLPNNYTREGVLDLLDSLGFKGKYDFLYFPIDFKTHAALGYAFLNLRSPEDAQNLWQRLDGFQDWSLPSGKVCEVSWSEPHQGQAAYVDRYRNSPLMHPSVPDEYRPMVFDAEGRIPFPQPTKKLKPPRNGTEKVLF